MSPRTSPRISLGTTAARERPRTAPRSPYAALARGCRPRGCRAPARRVHGRRVRYHIGCEPGQINGRRWRTGACVPHAG
ncbi:tryptophan synthase subunit(beta) [Streptomyces sp. HNM0575]|uniref:tryptophan biosynthesis modulator TrpM n=1 Tax=Streptomyces sp. HNM0575 TaxID=2716338 RepID=UPI00145E123A|nr:tryptophan synthase subunit(beta) [Streptomyces sp. HNM0575]NLU74625.1 tryptophan synthase subunit(beta) [Streptomyces sp. HNM0575]